MSVFGSKPEFNLQKNTVLVSKTNQFIVEDLIARGGYGFVIKCKKVETEERVAIKLVKRSQYDSGVNEMKIFKTLRQFKGSNTNIVKFLDHFEHNNHFCLAFEMLDINLYEYIRCRYFFPLDINEIRVLAQQLLVALKVLKELRVTHRDIKCDNIMLVDRVSQPLRVKLIDFGLSTRTYSMRNYVFKQPLSYRSPDVILDFPLDEAIDMWGLGCVLAFLYLGRHLFPSRAEYETLSVMVKLLGKPHDTLLTFGLGTGRFFKCVKGEFTYTWSLKTVEEYYDDLGEVVVLRPGVHSDLSCLDDLQKKRPEPKDPLEKRDLLSFIDLLKMMLDMNPSRRIAPLKALNHEFITMAHLSADSGCPYVIASQTKMVKVEEEEPEAENSTSAGPSVPQESLDSTPHVDGNKDSEKKATEQKQAAPDPGPTVTKGQAKPAWRPAGMNPTGHKTGASTSSSRHTTVPPATVSKNKNKSNNCKPGKPGPESSDNFSCTKSSSSVSSAEISASQSRDDPTAAEVDSEAILLKIFEGFRLKKAATSKSPFPTDCCDPETETPSDLSKKPTDVSKTPGSKDENNKSTDKISNCVRFNTKPSCLGGLDQETQEAPTSWADRDGKYRNTRMKSQVVKVNPIVRVTNKKLTTEDQEPDELTWSDSTRKPDRSARTTLTHRPASVQVRSDQTENCAQLIQVKTRNTCLKRMRNFATRVFRCLK
ncbi:dual specificity tyrosine-phosphorylation-regulated kinase 1B-like [Gambusia affinis]|uniref:dual specificity tyrosine-phosphorylation-regulated kinase 1B-like n=1 Tax=Gambusia affinis TaxID=33528 RepID=UPI001CDC381C|nr:dual specificity tyrosine-phosphorylation-regulated kinase 1B-like [Gambusia affinis]